jgi:hypothetical protein
VGSGALAQLVRGDRGLAPGGQPGAGCHCMSLLAGTMLSTVVKKFTSAQSGRRIRPSMRIRDTKPIGTCKE